MNAVELIWCRARDLYGDTRDRRRPVPGLAALLTALAHHGPVHGTALARLVEQDQGNTTYVRLPKLARLGFVDFEEVAGLGHQGGGRPARVWRLTRAGRELVAALAAEGRAAA